MPEKNIKNNNEDRRPRKTGTTLTKPPAGKKVRKMKSEAQVRREQERRKKIIKTLTAITFFFLAFYLGLALIIAAYIGISYITYGEKSDQYTFCTGYYYVNGSNQTVFYKETKSSIYFDGIQYVPASQIYGLSHFNLTGDGDDFSLNFDEKNKAEMRVGSLLAKVNGQSRILTYPPIKTEKGYFVPLEFIKSSFLGIEFTENSKLFIYEVQKNDLYSMIQLINVSNDAMQKPEQDFGIR